MSTGTKWIIFILVIGLIVIPGILFIYAAKKIKNEFAPSLGFNSGLNTTTNYLKAA